MIRRTIWVGGIALANAVAAGIMSLWVVQDAAGAGWDALVPSAVGAALTLSVGGLWWATRRQARALTGIGIGLAVGVLVHPAMW